MEEILSQSKISNNDYEDLVSKSLNLDKNKEKSIVDGKIVAIENDVVIVDVGLKSEGRIPLSEFSRNNNGPFEFADIPDEKSKLNGNFIIDKNINYGNYEPTSLLIPN